MVYKWKDGARVVKGLKAQIVGERIEQLAGANNRLTARVVLDDARSEDSPLHVAFEWDDTKAAEEYRLEQAANLMRCVVVRIHPEDTELTRAYINVGRDEDRRYEPVIRVLSDETLRREMLASAMAELRAFKKKWAHLNELAQIFEKMDEVQNVA